MNNLSSYCGLVDAKRASDKDLPVIKSGFKSRAGYDGACTVHTVGL